MSTVSEVKQTEHIDDALLDLDLRDNLSILSLLTTSQARAIDAANHAIPALSAAVDAAAIRLRAPAGRLVMVGAGASGRLAVQDGAELWPTYGWPTDRLMLSIAGGNQALLHSIEGVEDDDEDAKLLVESHNIGTNDVVVGLAASGSSRWTVAWIELARSKGALTIGMANNAGTPLLQVSEHPILLDSGAEVLAGSTRMAAGTAQKIALNMFSTLTMIRLNKTYGNLMVDMAATNTKLNDRRVRMLQSVVPDANLATASAALVSANGWVKLAALICLGLSVDDATQLLEAKAGSLRQAMDSCQSS